MARGLVVLGRRLRARGVEVSPARLRSAMEALRALDRHDRQSVYWALRASLISAPDHVQLFDEAFSDLWGGRSEGAGGDEGEPGSPGEPAASGEAAGEEKESRQDAVTDADGGADADAGEQEDEEATGRRWSAVERLMTVDFADYGLQEFDDARRVVERFARVIPRRESRRTTAAARGRLLDRRRTFQQAMRTDGHPIQREWRTRKLVPRRIVFLIDVSGSMEPYARGVMTFVHAVRRVNPDVEAFAFGTRLTRLTAELSHPDGARALHDAGAAVPDWAGGTRIGESLRNFNQVWGQGNMARGAHVVIVSDGWERGELDLIASEMARLQRIAHSVVWVNPLAADPDYEPLAGGMAAALEYVDVFIPGRDLAAMEQLAGVLASLPRRRPERRQRSSSALAFARAP